MTGDETTLSPHAAAILGIALSVSAVCVFGLMAWVTIISVGRQSQLLDEVGVYRRAYESCEIESVRSAFDRAASALELHAAPRLTIEKNKPNRRCELP